MPRRLFSSEAALFTPSFIAICCANLLFFIAGFMLVPVLPIYLLDDLHASKSTVGAILSTYMLGSLVMRPVSGFLVDQFQRKPLFLLCAVLCVIIYFTLTQEDDGLTREQRKAEKARIKAAKAAARHH